MISMVWQWKKPGIMLPDQDADAFDQMVDRLYGPQNKGRRKYLYALAIRRLLAMEDDDVKRAVHEIEAEERGVVMPGAEEASAKALDADLEKAKRHAVRPPEAKRSRKKSG